MWAFAVVLAVFAGWCHACPESCECRRIPEPEDLADLMEAVCVGRAPEATELPGSTRRLRILDADEGEVLGLVGELDDQWPATLPYLDEFEFRNCSLGRENLSAWLPGLERARILNLTDNQLVDLTEAGLAANLTSLRTFDARRNLVRELLAEAFGALPVLATLCLKGNDIRLVDSRAFAGLGALEDLDLSDNRLRSLPDSALAPLESLQRLDLSGNQLAVLGAGWFESLARLRELDVSRNGLARAASGVLQPLPGLAVLRLAGNPLRERDVSLLLGTGRRLETVDASRTGLIRVPAALTRSVRALRLAGNKLTSIRGGDLDSYPLLRLLDMSENRLIDVEEDALGRLEALEELDLSGNLLTEVPRSLPGSLTSLNLERNRVALLRPGDLQGLYSLRALLLRGNLIVEIREGALGQLSALELLDLSDNPVKRLPANTLNGPTRLKVLRMSGLATLEWDHREQRDMTFPVPAPERLVDLDLSRSPLLAAQLLGDTAALSACKSLARLDLRRTNLTTVRSDLLYFVPQLRAIGLAENPLSCTEDIYWLGEWSRDHEEIGSMARCSAGIFVRDLPAPPTPTSTSLATETAEEETLPTLGWTPLQEDPSSTLWRSEEDNSSLVETGSTMERIDENVTIESTIYSSSESSTEESNDREENFRIEKGVTVLPGNRSSPSEFANGNSSAGEDMEEIKRGKVEASGRTVAEELSGRATDSGARVSEALSAGAHPGMLVLVGAGLGAVAALSVVLSRRATARRRDCCYQRQENIEVHNLTPVTELW